MAERADALTQTIRARLSATPRDAQAHFDQALEIIVFGSMAAGLERPDSDIDVLCIGGPPFRHKTGALDLLVLPEEMTHEPLWTQSELASHVCGYGVWIKGQSRWINQVRIGEEAVEEKRRRVQAFMRSLPTSWRRLEEGFKTKYSIKIRREVQRLLLLARNVPVPPTATLDEHWETLTTRPNEVNECLRGLIPKGCDEFSRQFLAKVDANFRRSHLS